MTVAEEKFAAPSNALEPTNARERPSVQSVEMLPMKHLAMHLGFREAVGCSNRKGGMPTIVVGTGHDTAVGGWAPVGHGGSTVQVSCTRWWLGDLVAPDDPSENPFTTLLHVPTHNLPV